MHSVITYRNVAKNALDGTTATKWRYEPLASLSPEARKRPKGAFRASGAGVSYEIPPLIPELPARPAGIQVQPSSGDND